MLLNKTSGFALIIIFLLLIFAGCSQNIETVGNIDNDIQEKPLPIEETANEEEMTVNEEETETEINYQKIKPNEAGEIMVLMYHNIGKEEKDWVRTAENFRKDLQALYDNGYRPISLKDYVTGNITTEAGFSPVVITFDDGWQNQFNILEKNDDGYIIDSDCAVGILMDFHESHPDFPLEVTFFINNNVPFGQKEYLEYKLNFIVENGMDIGNHTASHIDLKGNVDKERINKEISAVKEMVENYVDGYEVNVLSLPLGHWPNNDGLKKAVIKEENLYENIGIVQVGWDPYKSPFSADFNPHAIHRIHGSDLKSHTDGFGVYDWMAFLEKGTRLKYVSDGNPDKVTVPEKYKDRIDITKIGDKELVTYILDDN